jgi:YgiT-type zinc finger domain-containing protein
MKCVICKSPDIQKKKVDEEIKFEKDIILVPVEVLVCNNCGERYYDSKTMRELEAVREKIGKKNYAVERVGEVLKAKVV